jgi:hypothetical protein
MWEVSFTPRPLYHRWKNSDTHWIITTWFFPIRGMIQR